MVLMTDKKQIQNALNVLINGCTMDDLREDDKVYYEAYDYLCEQVGVLVEKATPKKPHKEYVIDDTCYCCGNCHDIIDEVNYVDNGLYSKELVKYCRSCGQRIDWGDGSNDR